MQLSLESFLDYAAATVEDELLTYRMIHPTWRVRKVVKLDYKVERKYRKQVAKKIGRMFYMNAKYFWLFDRIVLWDLKEDE